MKRCIFQGVASVLLVSSLTFGQVKNLDLKKSISEQLDFPSQPRIPGASVLEGPVDPDSYILGPGDQLVFRVWGGIELERFVLVEPSGVVAIPTVGVIDISGRNITEADSLVKVAAKEAYPRGNVSFTLYKVRMMKASISGSVQNPGVYELSAVDRLSTLIQTAGGLLAPESEEDMQPDQARQRKRQIEEHSSESEIKSVTKQVAMPSMRHIRIKNASGKMVEIDYLKFARTGNADYNPILRDGDQVNVPPIDTDVGVLTVFGSVKIPGEYEYAKGDRLIDLITLAGGVTASASLDDIAIVRYDEQMLESYEISVELTMDGTTTGPTLQPDDRVFVRRVPDYRPQYNVVVRGEVRYPGVYPIEEDQTTLTEIIKACGGFTKRANLSSAKVTRRAMAEMEDPEFDRLKLMSVAEMSQMEYEYFKTRSRTDAPDVVVNFSDLFNPDRATQDITLRDKDEIVVPTISPTVNVAGQVNSPGLLIYVEGENYEYYIEKAGGFSWNARKNKLRLIKAQTGRWVKPDEDTTIDLGDTIFVPEEQEIDYWELWKDLLTVVSQVATILIVIQTVVR